MQGARNLRRETDPDALSISLPSDFVFRSPICFYINAVAVGFARDTSVHALLRLPK